MQTGWRVKSKHDLYLFCEKHRRSFHNAIIVESREIRIKFEFFEKKSNDVRISKNSNFSKIRTTFEFQKFEFQKNSNFLKYSNFSFFLDVYKIRNICPQKSPFFVIDASRRELSIGANRGFWR